MDRQSSAATTLHIHHAGGADRADGRLRHRQHRDRYFPQHQDSDCRGNLALQRHPAGGDRESHRAVLRAHRANHGQRRRAYRIAIGERHGGGQVFLPAGCRSRPVDAQITAVSQTQLAFSPPGTTPPFVLSYNASSVPILQLALSSDTLPESQIYDLGNTLLRTQLATVAGRVDPLSVWRQAAPGAGRSGSAGAARARVVGERRRRSHRRAESDPAGRHAEDRLLWNTSSSSTPARRKSTI